MIQMQNGEHSIGVSNDEDMPLVDAARRGELGAFEQLIRRYDQKVFRLARHITQNHQDAEDAAQDAFLKAFRGLSRFEGKARFSTWLFRIAVNESLMRLRHRRRTETVSLDEDTRSEPSSIPFEVADWRPNPEQLYDHAELKRVLAKALQRVPENAAPYFFYAIWKVSPPRIPRWH